MMRSMLSRITTKVFFKTHCITVCRNHLILYFNYIYYFFLYLKVNASKALFKLFTYYFIRMYVPLYLTKKRDSKTLEFSFFLSTLFFYGPILIKISMKG